jgi:hypothetical protein
MRTSMLIHHFSTLSLVLIIAVGVGFSPPVFDQSFIFVYGQNDESESADRDLNDDSNDNGLGDKEESDTNGKGIQGSTSQPKQGSDDSIVGCNTLYTNDPNYEYCTKQKPQGPDTTTDPKVPSDTNKNNIPNSETTTTTQKSFNPAGKYKPGSGQTKLSIPGKSEGLARPLTPGAGNSKVEGIPVQPNTNPQTPINPENIPTKIGDRWAHLTVYTNYTNTNMNAEICVFTSQPYEVKANPYCTEGSPDGTFHLVQAPGQVGIRASSSFFDTIDTSDCEFKIYPKEFKSCVINFSNSPFLKSKSETSGQDRLRTPIG